MHHGQNIEQHGSNMCIVEMLSCGGRNGTEQDKEGGHMSLGVFLVGNHSKPSAATRSATISEFWGMSYDYARSGVDIMSPSDLLFWYNRH